LPLYRDMRTGDTSITPPDQKGMGSVRTGDTSITPPPRSTGAATSGVYRAFDHEVPIAVAYYVRGRVRIACFAQEHDVVALLHEARRGGR
jgi:hypothetical protein